VWDSMRKCISLFLVFSILTLSIPLTAKERKGADLIIQRTDGTQVRGELIAVKKYSLLLLDTEGRDVSVIIEDIKVITILKKLKSSKGALYGLLIGGAIGVAFGYSADPDTPPSRGVTAAISGVSVGLLGASIGVAAGTNEKIQIEGKSDSEIQIIMEKLRKKARVKNFQ
jgi:hypothetical protein